MFFNDFHMHEAPKCIKNLILTGPRPLKELQDALRGAKNAPRRPKRRSKTLQETPKTLQERSYNILLLWKRAGWHLNLMLPAARVLSPPNPP